MSFSGKVKDELLERYPTARHCMLAELAAITFCCGRVSWENNNIQNMEIYTENEGITRKYFKKKKIEHAECWWGDRTTGPPAHCDGNESLHNGLTVI